MIRPHFALLALLPGCASVPDAFSGLWVGSQTISLDVYPAECNIPPRDEGATWGISLEIAELADGRMMAIPTQGLFFGNPERDRAIFSAPATLGYSYVYDLLRDGNRLTGEIQRGSSEACKTWLDLGRAADVREVPEGIAGRWLMEGGCFGWLSPPIDITVGDAGEVYVNTGSFLVGSFEGGTLDVTSAWSPEDETSIRLIAQIEGGVGHGTYEGYRTYEGDPGTCPDSRTITLTRLDTEVDW